MEKVLQEFRIIETDDGFRIEIKGDKEELRDFVMSLDPRRWMHGDSHSESHRGPHGWGPFPFGPGGPRFKMKFGRGFGPFGFAWDDAPDEGDDDDRPPRRRKRGYGGRGRRGKHGRHGHHGEHHDHAHDEDAEEII